MKVARESNGADTVDQCIDALRLFVTRNSIHKLNNSLQSVLGFSMLARRKAQAKANLEECMDEIVEGARAMKLGLNTVEAILGEAGRSEEVESVRRMILEPAFLDAGLPEGVRFEIGDEALERVLGSTTAREVAFGVGLIFESAVWLRERGALLAGSLRLGNVEEHTTLTIIELEWTFDGELAASDCLELCSWLNESYVDGACLYSRRVLDCSAVRFEVAGTGPGGIVIRVR